MITQYNADGTYTYECDAHGVPIAWKGHAWQDACPACATDKLQGYIDDAELATERADDAERERDALAERVAELERVAAARGSVDGMRDAIRAVIGKLEGMRAGVKASAVAEQLAEILEKEGSDNE